MMKKHWLSLLWAVILVFGLLLPAIDSSEPPCIGPDECLIHVAYDSVLVDSDADFAAGGWTGNGSLTNPYALQSEELGWLEIRNTRSHFVVDGCGFNAAAAGVGTNIELRNVSNCIIRHCHAYGGFVGLSICNVSDSIFVNNTLTACRVDLLNSQGILIENNTVQEAPYYALLCWDVVRAELKNNSFVRGLRGVEFGGANCTIQNNTIANHYSALDLSWSTSNISVLHNRLAVCEGNTTRDDGQNNAWLGNAYSDYSGFGSHSIPGSASSTDLAASLFTPTYSLDILGPTIIGAYVGSFICIDYNERPASFGFWATVTDVSGVAFVHIIINGDVHEMTHSPTEANPNRYVYDLPDPVSEGFIVMHYRAQDTLGHSSETDVGQLSIGVFPWGPPDDNDPNPDTMPILEIGIAFILTIGVFIYLLRRSRRRLIPYQPKEWDPTVRIDK